MVCQHLAALEKELMGRGLQEKFRSQAWSINCREWVYFRCVLDLASLRERFQFDACVQNHEHEGTHDGHEVGFVCDACHDAIMGGHPRHEKSLPLIR